MIERREIKTREEWLAWRKSDVTASTIGALFNCHPYNTALRMYAEKRGTEFPFEDNPAMRRGRWLEPAVAKAVEEMRPDWKLIPAKEYLRDPELRIGATPDFYIFSDTMGRGICQTKTVAPSVFARDWNDGKEVPLWIILQAQTEAMLAGADFSVVAGLLVDAHNMEVSIHELPRHPEAEAKIKAAVAQFWKDVENGHEPEADFARDKAVIDAMWKREVPKSEIDFTGNNHIPALLAERATLMNTRDDLEKRIEAITNELKFEMKDAAMAIGIDGWRVTYRTTSYKEYHVAARESRVLRILDRREKAE